MNIENLVDCIFTGTVPAERRNKLIALVKEVLLLQEEVNTAAASHGSKAELLDELCKAIGHIERLVEILNQDGWDDCVDGQYGRWLNEANEYLNNQHEAYHKDRPE